MLPHIVSSHFPLPFDVVAFQKKKKKSCLQKASQNVIGITVPSMSNYDSSMQRIMNAYFILDIGLWH